MSASLTPTLQILLGHRSLTMDESREAFQTMMGGDVSPAEIGALLALLASRIPTADELVGAASVMRDHVARVPSQTDPELVVDTCGTGGAPKTFNVSTTAAVVAAAAGARVAKHGNRSRTGRGSADALKALGVNVDADRETQARCLDDVGICFCFAIHHHPATKNVVPARQALGVPTIFNLLGPLTNPVGAKRQLLGVYDARFLTPVAHALRALGTSRAMVFHSDDGLDELSISAPTQVMHVSPDGVTSERVAPEDFGMSRAPREAVVARDLEHAAQLMREVISGKERGPARDMTLLAAAGALLVADQVRSLDEGVKRAREAIDAGKASAVLAAWIERSNGR
jgi:anthranilate phosphoribosyltransferase